MLKETSHKVKRYEYDDFYIEIADVGDYWEAWLCRKDMGTFEYMFGWLKVQHPHYKPEGEAFTYADFLEMVENCLPDYTEDYNEYHPKGA